ncbi:MAG: SMC family ATPase [Actinomycetota bacterium]
MRPLELRLEGFKSYRSAQEFSFDSRTLFGIVGPTGAGKSTILEALIFALYGKTPRVERDTKKLINSQDDSARVSLAFDVDERAWEVTRMIRRKGASQTVLRRLDGGGEPVAGDRNVNDQITQLLGLDFAAFCSSVSLPQGEFDRFLKATPSERSKILKGIFRLERVDLLREAARRHWSSIDGQWRGLQAELEGLPEDPQGDLVEAQRRADEARSRHEAISRELPAVIECERDQRALDERLRGLRRELEQTESAMARLPSEETLRDLAESEAAASKSLEQARSDLQDATERLDAVSAEESRAGGGPGGENWFVDVARALETRQRLARSVEAVRAQALQLEAGASSAEVSAQQARQAEESARRALDEVSGALEELQQQHAAHLLRLDLKPGEPCPVCTQRVVELPDTTALANVDEAQQAVSRCRAAHAEAAAAAQRAGRDWDLAKERLRIAADQERKLAGELEDNGRQLRELTDGVADPQAELDRRSRAVKEARDAVAGARQELKAADRREREARELVDRLQANSTKLANALAHTSGLVGIRMDGSDDAGLWETAKKVIEAAEQRRDDLMTQMGKAQRRAQDARLTVEEFRVRFGATPDMHAGEVLTQASTELSRLEWTCDQLKTAIRRRQELREHLDELAKRKARFERLVADFSDSKFTAFLLNEQRKLLARIGSEKLLELTGHYAFDEEGEFQIVDQRTGMTRSPDTLSGGETFLASLSLALALSEAVSLEGGRLGCFFLDEGFGSLDQESLDLALEGIEALAVPGRLIGLISHVGGIQARLDDLIVLEKQSDGSTEVVQQEGPIGFAPSLI